jgi:hypothetical protein
VYHVGADCIFLGWQALMFKETYNHVIWRKKLEEMNVNHAQKRWWWWCLFRGLNWILVICKGKTIPAIHWNEIEILSIAAKLFAVGRNTLLFDFTPRYIGDQKKKLYSKTDDDQKEKDDSSQPVPHT